MATQKLSRQDVTTKTGLSYPTICQLINAEKPKPSLDTILKLANGFEVSIDQILGRKTPAKQFGNLNFNLSTTQALRYLQTYLIKRFEQDSTNSKKLSITLGFNATSISEFLMPQGRKNSLGTNIITALSDHFSVPIDEMIGRTINN